MRDDDALWESRNGEVAGGADGQSEFGERHQDLGGILVVVDEVRANQVLPAGFEPLWLCEDRGLAQPFGIHNQDLLSVAGNLHLRVGVVAKVLEGQWVYYFILILSRFCLVQSLVEVNEVGFQTRVLMLHRKGLKVQS